MSKIISKNELVGLIAKATEEVLEKNESLLENHLEDAINLSVQLSVYTTLKVLDELQVINME